MIIKTLNTFASVTGTLTQRRFAIMPLRYFPLALRYVPRG